MNKSSLQQKVDEIVSHFGSQRATAKAAGIAQSSVAEWVSGQTKPSLRSLIRIERASKKKFKAKEIRPELF